MTDLQPEVEDSEPVAPIPGPAGTNPTPKDASEAAPETTSDVAPDTAPEPQPAAVGPSFRVMQVDDVALDLPSQYPVVTLVESQPPWRDLVFPVGLPEGTALAQALRRLEGRRPMTHELFMQVLQRVHIDVVAVRLTGREEGNLLAELDLMAPGGRERVDCRPSDGLVLALRMPVPSPILVDERLLESQGDVTPVREQKEP